MMTMTNTEMKPIDPKTIDSVRAAFGEHPEDVLAAIGTGSNTLMWLAAVFDAIRVVSDHGHRATKAMLIEQLAEVGSYVATDMSDLLEVRRETMEERVRDAA